MAAAGQQDMITILWIYNLKLNEPWAHCMALVPSLKNPEELSGNRNSTERLCKNEPKSMILIGFQQIFAT